MYGVQLHNMISPTTTYEYIPTPQQLISLATSHVKYTVVLSNTHSLYYVYPQDETASFELELMGIIRVSAESTNSIYQLGLVLSEWANLNVDQFNKWCAEHNRTSYRNGQVNIPKFQGNYYV